MSDTVAMWGAIKSLEKALAALDSKFERLMQHFVTMDERVTDFMVDCQKQSIALESPAAAPDPVCADPNCGHRHSDHYDKGCNVEVLGAFGVRYVCTCRKFVLVPTAEPEPVCAFIDMGQPCACGHVYGQHFDDLTEGCSHDDCDCQSFTFPTAEPAPLDPVLAEDLERVLYAAEGWASEMDTGVSKETVIRGSIERVRRAYGRDGAR